MDFQTFADMGGYAVYVWGSYGLAVLGYGGVLVWALMQYENAREKDTK